MALACLIILACSAVCAAPADSGSAQSRVDFRYAPPSWQTAICLPDDWQKTLVDNKGALLYDFRGRFGGFRARITAGLAEGAELVGQDLVSPRVPIVRTRKRQGTVEIVEEVFAVAPRLPPDPSLTKCDVLRVERVGGAKELVDWAVPVGICEPAYRHTAVGYNEPIRYRFPAAGAQRYTVVFGFCEGWHQKPRQRVLELQIEGKARQTVDLVARPGQNRPALFAVEASDENGDGWIDVAVAAAKGSPDQNTILSVLWVFAGDAPPVQELLPGYASRPALAHVVCGAAAMEPRPPRHDVMIVRLRNTGTSAVTVRPIVTIEDQYPVYADQDGRQTHIGPSIVLSAAAPAEIVEEDKNRWLARFDAVTLQPGQERRLAFGLALGSGARPAPQSLEEATTLRAAAESFWQKADLPYGRIEVPDAGVQALLDSSIRNIYQAREIKKGLPSFQVGPTCYRGLWIVDGSFLLEAVTFLGRADEVRNGIRHMLSFQRDDGTFMLIDGHWKETGIVLWAVTRHARLTNDPLWLQEVWPKVEHGFQAIEHLRATAATDASAPNYRLIPPGMSDGGLGGKFCEYTNVYWNLVGMHAAVEAAQWLRQRSPSGGRLASAKLDQWQRAYDDFLQTFRRAADRDARLDAHGNRYVPIRMSDGEDVAPQRAQWAFLHALFPGKLFAADDPLVRGNMAMLKAVEREGLVYGTGWIADGIWNYFGSFYAHAWLWTGDGAKAAELLYAFANHASPLLAWREEQALHGQPERICGDMPHNWASAEFIRLVRDLLVLERGEQLHLLEGLPAAWLKPGATIALHDVLTEFGPFSMELRVAGDGRTATLKTSAPTRNPPNRFVLHLGAWAGESEQAIELPSTGRVERAIRLRTVTKK